MEPDPTDPQLAYTFEMQRWAEDDWHKSSGRWDTPDGAVDAAAKLLKVAVENSFEAVAVRIVTVHEFPLIGA